MSEVVSKNLETGETTQFNVVVNNVPPKKQDTEATKKMKANFGFFGPATFVYAVLYAFCMFKNDAGVTFPFFVAGSLLFLCFTLSKLEISLRKGSAFYMVSMMLLAVSTFCTDDGSIINLNKTGIFFLMMSLLLNQFFNTDKWRLGKYFYSILELLILSCGEIGRPFVDGGAYYKDHGRKNKNLWYGILGVVIAIPMLLVVAALLSGADAVFREMTNNLLDLIQPGNIFNVVFRVCFIFFASYSLTAFLCKRSIREEVESKRKGEPILAITVTSLLSLIYLLFSGIQIFGLFLGKMQLPAGYTYAKYAREGFFQLLAVSIINLVIVLFCMSFFKESKILKGVLTVMSLCTFVMIASSAMRMIIYIRYYYLTFLRVFVLWALVLLFALFVGVVISIYKEQFPLFRYGVTVVSILYIAFSFSHPDYIIAKVNVANAPRAEDAVREKEEDFAYGDEFFGGEFFLGEYYKDYRYLTTLSADAAPVLIPYMKELGYHTEVYHGQDIFAELKGQGIEYNSWELSGFGYYYLNYLKQDTEGLNVRTFNVSRYMAHLQMKDN